MKIRKMNATFGKLSRRTLELGDGLNIVTGGNEAGKSTWCGFIRAMLFGINTREQSKSSFLADKEKFRPWSGEPMHGRMEVEWTGRRIAIEREAGRAGPFQNSTVTDMETGLAVPELAEPGEALTGVKREVFERSAFIGQAGLRVDNDKSGELERRIVSLAGTGEEEISYTQVVKRLEKWKRRRRYHNRGEAPELETREAELRRTLDSLREDARALTAKRAQIEKLREDERVYGGQAEVWKSLRAWEQIHMSQDAEMQLDAAERACQSAEQAARFAEFLPDAEFLQNLQQAYEHTVDSERNYTISIETARKTEEELAQEKNKLAEYGPLAGLRAGDAERTAAEAVQSVRTAQEEAFGRRWLPWFLLSFLAGAAAGAALWFLSPALLELTFPLRIALAVGAGAVILAAGALAGGWSVRRRIRENQEIAAGILREYQVSSPEEILERAAASRVQLERVEQAAETAAAAKNGVDRAEIARREAQKILTDTLCELDPEATEQDAPKLLEQVRSRLNAVREAEAVRETARARAEAVRSGRNMDAFLAQAEAVAPGTPKPEYSEQELTSKLAYIRDTLHELELDCSALQARINHMGGQGDLQEQLEETRHELARKRAEEEALACALEELAQAEGELRRKFAPALEKRAGEIFERLTGGRFRLVDIQNAQMDVTVREEAAAPARRVLELSQGTVDELYLAMRLALCECLSSGQQASPPVILDDALVNFDDERMGRALDFLEELSHSRQVILFSCQGREAAYFAGKAHIHIQSL